MGNETTVTIRQYRFLPPLDWSEDCEAEMRRMTALWNTLVEIDRAHTERYRAATADDPTVAELQTQYKTLSAEVEALIEAQKGRPRQGPRPCRDAGTGRQDQGAQRPAEIRGRRPERGNQRGPHQGEAGP